MDLAVSHTTMYLFGIMWSYEQEIILLGWGLSRHFNCAFLYFYFVTFLYHHNSMELHSIVNSISIQSPASDVLSAPLCLFVIHPWTAQLGGKEVPWPGRLELKATPMPVPSRLLPSSSYTTVLYGIILHVDKMYGSISLTSWRINHITSVEFNQLK